VAIEEETISVTRSSSEVVRILLASELISALMSPPCDVHYADVVKQNSKLRHPAVLLAIDFIIFVFHTVMDRNLQPVLHCIWDNCLAFWVSVLAQNSIVLWGLMQVFPVRLLSSVFPFRDFFLLFFPSHLLHKTGTILESFLKS